MNTTYYSGPFRTVGSTIGEELFLPQVARDAARFARGASMATFCATEVPKKCLLPAGVVICKEEMAFKRAITAGPINHSLRKIISKVACLWSDYFFCYLLSLSRPPGV